MRLQSFVFIILLNLCACANKTTSDTLETLFEVDLAFSKLSEENGMQEAFLSYIDENGVILRRNSMPIVGRSTLSDLYEESGPFQGTLTWKPLDGQISDGGDLGFTYGTYTIKLPDTVRFGTYVSIWKKNEKGEWKFVLDTGNQGLGK